MIAHREPSLSGADDDRVHCCVFSVCAIARLRDRVNRTVPRAPCPHVGQQACAPHRAEYPCRSGAAMGSSTHPTVEVWPRRVCARKHTRWRRSVMAGRAGEDVIGRVCHGFLLISSSPAIARLVLPVISPALPPAPRQALRGGRSGRGAERRRTRGVGHGPSRRPPRQRRIQAPPRRRGGERLAPSARGRAAS